MLSTFLFVRLIGHTSVCIGGYCPKFCMFWAIQVNSAETKGDLPIIQLKFTKDKTG